MGAGMTRTAYLTGTAPHSVEMRPRRGYGVGVSRTALRNLIALTFLSASAAGCGGSHSSEGPAPTDPGSATTEADPSPTDPGSLPSEPAAGGSAPSASREEVSATLARANQFGFDLYQRLRGAPGNLVISPASVHLALAMTSGGARGETAEQMATVLHVDPASDAVHASYQTALALWNGTTPATLRVANRIFADRTVPVEPAFVSLTDQRYGAPIERLDFMGAADPSRLAINRWVEERTEERIADLLPAGSITALTRMVLANAVYFKGTWQTQFDPRETQPRRFQVDGRTDVDVPSMRQQGRFSWVNHPDGVRVLELPYAGGDLSMVWLLPATRSGAGALAAVEAQLSQESLARWRSALTEVSVEVQIPRFRMAPPTIRLSDTLQELGMPLAFDAHADFRGIADLPDGLYISEVFHKAFVEVNEEGTEAAAATAVVMVTRRAGPAPQAEPPRFIADHPFLFLLMDRRTGAVLFVGRVTDPR